MLDVRCPDDLPIQAAQDRYVRFRFEPDYVTGKSRRLRADGEIGPTLPWSKKRGRSAIALDGRKVVMWGERTIVADKTFRENAGHYRDDTFECLRAGLDLAELIPVTLGSGDPTGQSVGMVCWLGERRVLVNDYSTISGSFRRRIRESLGKYELD